MLDFLLLRERERERERERDGPSSSPLGCNFFSNVRDKFVHNLFHNLLRW